MKKWFKILPVICLLTAQVILAAHTHSPDEAVLEQDCIYCQTASELASSATPELFTIAAPVYYQIAKASSLSQNIVCYNLIYRYDTRAPPLA